MTNTRRAFSKFTLHGKWFLFFMLAALFFGVSSFPAHAAFGVLSKENKACLDCHSKEGYSKKRADGEVVSLRIADKPFSESVHNDNDCTECHTGLDIKKHAKANNQKIGTREYSLAQVAVCADCHSKNVKLYNGSLHASLVREGNSEAPICSDCHDSHTVRAHSSNVPMGDVVCRSCHGKIYKAYASSMHGLARGKQGDTSALAAGEKKAPICADCHRAHEIKAAATEGRIKDACLGCHKDASQKHKLWLPNVDQHFEVIACPVCHVATAKRRVDLRLYDSKTNKELAEKQGVPQFEGLVQKADSQGLGLDAMALQGLLTQFNSEGSVGKTVLRGRLEVSSGIEGHQLVGKTQAIKDCDTCHREGADVFQSVTISIATPDGRTLHHGAQKEVLTSAMSVDSVRGFYAIGGTRIKLLDILFILALIAGISIVVGHSSLRIMSAIYWKQMAAERKTKRERITDHPQNPDQPLSGDNSKHTDTTQE